MNILFIANLVPFPLDSGGKIKTFTSIQALSKNNLVDLLCFYEQENCKEAESALKPYCRNIKMIPIRVTTSENIRYMMFQALKCLFSLNTISVYKYHRVEMENEICKFMDNYDYQVAYFNILQVYSYKKQIKSIKKDIKCILDTQNCETQIIKRYAQESNNIFKKLYLKFEEKKLKRFERWAIKDADKLILLSNEDKIQLERLCRSELKCEVIPIGVLRPSIVKVVNIDKADDTINILFLGTLTWAPNSEGIIWFLENVIQKLGHKIGKFHLYIVGKNPGNKLKELANQFSNITITGYVDSVDEYYEKCDFMIVPLFIGSGQRVKIIESFSRGMPVLSTSVGAEGLMCRNGEDILIADDAENFVRQIEVMRDKKIRKKLSCNGRKLFEKYYSVEAVAKKLCDVVDCIQK